MAQNNPPLQKEALSSDEWLSDSCKSALPTGDDVSASSAESVNPFQEKSTPNFPLSRLNSVAATRKQYQLACNASGSSKKTLYTRRPKKNRTKHEEVVLAQLPNSLCYYCKRSCRYAPLVQCDVCPLLFHCDCLDPPLPFLPASIWTCPNHSENLIDQKVLASLRSTERVKVYNTFSGPVKQDAIKLSFLKNTNSAYPSLRGKDKPSGKPYMSIPDAVIQHYASPLDHLPPLKTPIPTTLNSYIPCEKEELIKLLKNILHFQAEVVKYELENIGAEEDISGNKSDDIESMPVKEISRLFSADTVSSVEVVVPPVKIKKEEDESISGTKAASSKEEQMVRLPNKHLPSSTSSNSTPFSLQANSSTCKNIDSTQDEASTDNSEPEFTPENVKNVYDYLLKKNSGFDDDDQLSEVDEELMYRCAYKYMKLLCWKVKEENVSHSDSLTSVKRETSLNVNQVRARALLVPLNVKREPVLMPYRTMDLGLGQDMGLCFSNFGHCNYLSAKHATIFYDEFTKQYELINYSFYGTMVDNVLYCSNTSIERPTNRATGLLSSSIHRLRRNTPRLQNLAPPSFDTDPPTPPEQEKTSLLPCLCLTSHANLSQDNTGNEASALLHHGSLIQCGCLQFVFSIVEYGQRINEMALAAEKRPGSQQNLCP